MPFEDPRDGGLQVPLYGARVDVDASADLYLIDPASGVASVIGPIGYSTVAIAFDPTTGKLYGVTDAFSASPEKLIEIDPATGAGTLIGDTDDSGHFPVGNFADITISPRGNAYGWIDSDADSVIASINKETGDSTVFGPPGTGLGGIDYVGLTLYHVPWAAGDEIVFVDPTDGTTTTAGVLAAIGGDQVNAMSADNLGRVYLLTTGTPASLFTVNVVTGAVTHVSDVQLDGDDLDIRAIAFRRRPSQKHSVNSRESVGVQRLTKIVLGIDPDYGEHITGLETSPPVG